MVLGGLISEFISTDVHALFEHQQKSKQSLLLSPNVMKKNELSLGSNAIATKTSIIIIMITKDHTTVTN